MIELSLDQAHKILRLLKSLGDPYQMHAELQAKVDAAERLDRALEAVADGDEELEETRRELLEP